MHYPLTRLSHQHAAAIEAHLLRLSPEDRSLRFAAGVVSDEAVRRYVRGLRFDHDVILGLVSLRGTMFGLAHGCVYTAGHERHIEAAFSVDAEWRQRGCGTALMKAMHEHARGAGIGTVVGLCAARNRPMRAIFERARMQLTREGDEILARGLVVSPAA
jgi:GNAT superfamily N-acetyltransferase